MDDDAVTARRRHRAAFLGCLLLSLTGSGLGRTWGAEPTVRWVGLAMAAIGVVGMFVSGIRALAATVRVRSRAPGADGAVDRPSDHDGHASS